MSSLAQIEQLRDLRLRFGSPALDARRQRKPVGRAALRASELRHAELRRERLQREAEERAREAEQRALDADRAVLNRAGPTIRAIIIDVCRRHELRPSAAFSRRHVPDLVHCRHEIMWHARRTSRFSLPEIARRLGGYDHTTILWGIRQHERRMADQGGEGER